MSDWIPVIVAIIVPIILRLIDYLLPKGHHFRVVHRFAVKDEDKKEDDTGDGVV